jgi:hypothetical protein
MNNNYMMYVWSKSFVVPAETIFLLICKDGPLENFDRFLQGLKLRARKPPCVTIYKNNSRLSFIKKK